MEAEKIKEALSRNRGGKRDGAGRPIAITEDRLKKLYVCRMADLNKQQICNFIGVSRWALEDWIANAKRVEELLEQDEEALLSPKDQLYLRFSYVWHNAKTELILECLGGIRKAGKENFHAYTFILERIATDKWGRREAQPVGVAEGVKPAQIEEEHLERDPYEQERFARIIMGFEEAGINPADFRKAIIDRARAIAEVSDDEVHTEDDST